MAQVAAVDRAAQLTATLLALAKTPKDQAAVRAAAEKVAKERTQLCAVLDAKVDALLALDPEDPHLGLRAAVALRQLRGAHARLLEHVEADGHELDAIAEAKARPRNTARSILKKGLPDALRK